MHGSLEPSYKKQVFLKLITKYNYFYIAVTVAENPSLSP